MHLKLYKHINRSSYVKHTINFILPPLLFKVIQVSQKRYEKITQNFLPNYVFLKQKEMQNNLANQHSLYLRQHAKNPVHWQPWSEATLTMAKAKDKPLIISIGYSSCHWCHVMEKEVFEHHDAAKLMNDNFICIKVDREELPHIDHLYMDAVQMIAGSGGWPLNVFALSDGTPFYGGTYFPKENWNSLVERLSITYKTKRELINQTANEIAEKLVLHEKSLQNKNVQAVHGDFKQILNDQWRSNFDHRYGGEMGAPKFPMPVKLGALLDLALIENNVNLQQTVFHTLSQMAAGGIYDHVGGGFARYSVDEKWLVPHFEKMLYDNAQLLPLYAKANAVKSNTLFEHTLSQSFEFLKREMKVGKGMYASAIDADSEGVEGKYYVWNYDDFASVIEDSKWIDFFGVTEAGNWEKTNVLHFNFEQEHVYFENENSKTFLKELDAIKQNLLLKREERIRPVRDDKAITSWNALLARGFLEVYQYNRNESYLKEAQEVLNNITSAWKSNGYLPRMLNYEATEGYLDDYAFAMQAVYKLYIITHEEKWLKYVEELMKYTLKKFKGEGDVLLNFYPIDQQLFSKKAEWMDTVIPSSNSVIAELLFDLGYVLKRTELSAMYFQMIDQMKPLVYKYPLALGGWVKAALMAENKYFVSVGADHNSEEIHAYFNRNHIWPDMLPLKEQTDQIIVCKGNNCYEPVSDIVMLKSFLID